MQKKVITLIALILIAPLIMKFRFQYTQAQTQQGVVLALLQTRLNMKKKFHYRSLAMVYM